MPRLDAQGLTALILVGAVTLAQASGPVIGVAVAEGSFRVDNSEVYGNTTLFDGAVVQTEKSSSRLQLKDGTRMDLGADSRARIFEKRTTLEQGQGVHDVPAGGGDETVASRHVCQHPLTAEPCRVRLPSPPSRR